MKDGIIEIDSKRGKSFDFTSDRFTAYSYLWKTGDEIWVSLICAKNPGKGSFSALVKAINAAGYSVVVPTPSARMAEICAGYQFKHDYRDTDMGTCEVFVGEPR